LFEHGPADATATPTPASFNPDWFTFLVPAYPVVPGPGNLTNTTPGLSRRLGKPAFSCRPNRPTVFSTHRFRSRWSDRVSSPRRSCRRSRCRRRRAGAASRRRWTTRTCIYLAHRWSPGSPARHSTDRLDSRRADHTPSTHARTHTAADGPARCTPVSTWQSTPSTTRR